MKLLVAILLTAVVAIGCATAPLKTDMCAEWRAIIDREAALIVTCQEMPSCLLRVEDLRTLRHAVEQHTEKCPADPGVQLLHDTMNNPEVKP